MITIPNMNLSNNLIIKSIIIFLFMICMLVILNFNTHLISEDNRYKYADSLTRNISKSTAQTYYISIQSGDWRRLGNLMFNYAALLGIAKRNNMIPVLKLNSQETELFHIFHISIQNCSKNFFLTLSNRTRFTESAPVRYDPRTRNLQALHTELVGAYESYKYFEDIDIHRILHRDFAFKENILSVAKNKMQREKVLLQVSDNYVLVGIHARRGDFVRLSGAGYTPPNAQYFHNAIRHMKTFIKKDILWVVSSDDIYWCEQNLNFTSEKVVYTNTSSYVIDLAMLSLCDHMIISAGSYSWWAAWLVNGTTIFFKNWPRPGSQLTGVFSYDDYYPKHWIPIT